MTSRPQAQWSTPRAFPRYLIDQRLIFKAGRVFHGRTKDISEGGLAATIAGELDETGVVELEFHLPGKPTPLQLTAEIRYRHGFQYGFRFVNLTEQQRALIREATVRLPLAP
jgi:hypothetical protein